MDEGFNIGEKTTLLARNISFNFFPFAFLYYKFKSINILIDSQAFYSGGFKLIEKNLTNIWRKKISIF